MMSKTVDTRPYGKDPDKSLSCAKKDLNSARADPISGMVLDNRFVVDMDACDSPDGDHRVRDLA